jgi:hypothetical protein
MEKFGKMKLELESIYKEYCNSDLEAQGGKDKFIDMMLVFVEFRLGVSGGDEGGCMVSMYSVSNFLDEIFLYNNLMDDWSGQYRGDFRWENFDKLNELIGKSELEENIKIEILEGFRKYYNMDEDEE